MSDDWKTVPDDRLTPACDGFGGNGLVPDELVKIPGFVDSLRPGRLLVGFDEAGKVEWAKMEWLGHSNLPEATREDFW